MMLKIVIDLFHKDVAEISKITESRRATSGYAQSFGYHVKMAIAQFIRKYSETEVESVLRFAPCADCNDACPKNIYDCDELREYVQRYRNERIDG